MEGKKRIPVRINDLKAKRFSRREFIVEVVSKDLHKKWQKQTGSELEYKTFCIIWKEIANTIQDQVVNNPSGVRLPFFNGDITTNYYQYINRHHNSKASQELGYQVPELDWHSDGRQGKVIWSINHARKQHRWLILFAFQPSRALKIAASRGMKTQPEIYRYARTTSYIAHKLIQNERR